MRRSLTARVRYGRTIPVLVVIAALVAIWYGFAVYLNAAWQLDIYAKAKADWTVSDLVSDTLNQERPVLPSAHQVFVEIWNTTV